MNLKEQLKGTGVALVTPFKENFEVDFDALGKLIDFCLSNGVEYLTALGTTAEAPTLSKQEKIDIVNFVYDKANGKPVVVGIGGNNTREIIHELETFPLDKATAILSASPYYNKPSQEGLYQHYKAIAAASPKPVLLYNVPGRTGRNLEASTVNRLAHEVKNIGGIKEASGLMEQCMHIIRDSPEDFLIVSGDDHVTLPLIAAGMHGVISVTANCFPKEFSDMTRYCLAGDYAAARPLHYKCLEGNDLLFEENNPSGVKAFLAELGIIKNVLRLPLVPLSQPVHDRVKKYLKEEFKK
ncbi:4-hydroxy-tetrahydrodipicolinate synthase [Ferruginibacter albus]|uniref:4-hydroxy-tetrahydrodipicolinate synthase n=1 Tax=Ferruginibacter albus TaxID=2875540 RepID=UPI001CC68ACB|nr:4-hydroxy-tetrahydrodipicolinate synthase [Ferruginibacter albus]UAY50806.1 4-hydroxy-tetrahydrodipicolinate synthase [Ferruginibacter albus]